MAEYGEWSRKGATLSDVTARKEYGVDSDFIVTGINAGKLEYREGAIHGNPYIRVLRGQLEAYIVEELGDDHLRSWQGKTELREVTREMAQLRKRLYELEARRAQLEGRPDRYPDPRGGLTFAPATKAAHNARVAATGVTE